MSQRTTPCRDCPFARHTEPGCTGGSSVMTYVGQAQGPFFLPCHNSPGYEEDRNSKQHEQCAGAAIFRSNIEVQDRLPLDLLRLPKDTESVFETLEEFIVHHNQIPESVVLLILQIIPPIIFMYAELGIVYSKELQSRQSP